MAPGVTVSGEVAATAYAHMRRTWGADVWTRVLARLTPEESALVSRVSPGVSLPITVDGHVYEALVAEAFGGDLAVAERELRKAGAEQAAPSLRRVVGPFGVFLTPKQAFARAGDIVTDIYSGTRSTTEPVLGNGGVIRIFGLREACYAAPWQCGWMEGALTMFGATGAHVTERSWQKGRIASDELVYDVTWG
jgi:hypothetical protein